MHLPVALLVASRLLLSVLTDQPVVVITAHLLPTDSHMRLCLAGLDAKLC